MIVDRLENWSQYPFGEAWKEAFDFLGALTPDAEEKKYLLLRDTLFAGIDRYETRPLETAVLEAHRKYIDVQVLLQGRETIDWYPLDGLNVKTPYDPATDVEFYHRPETLPTRILLTPGTFAVFFPQDAHSPQIVAGQPEFVKKTVVKIGVDLLLHK